MTRYSIVDLNGNGYAVDKDKFKSLYRTREYELYEQGSISVLLHKGNERAAAAYRFHHNHEANEWGKNDRLNRCRDDKGNVCMKDCRLCNTERQSHAPVSLDERLDDFGLDIVDDEVDVEATVINKVLNADLNVALDLVETDERHILKALYGINVPPMTLSEYAKSRNMEYFAVRNLRDRALRRVAKVAPHLREYL